jgi:tetratricopeptide (TPR) repeat protein
MAGRLLDDDPERAYAHAQAAAARAGRVAAVREAAGLAAYAAGHYAEALRELRAATRMSGSPEHLPVMADCERGLGRPERALALVASPDAARLDRAGQVELRIVAAGARQDMGQADAAVVTLQCRELTARTPSTWSARLRYAYAEALLAVGREQEALTWFERAAQADVEGATDAADRAAELSGLHFVDLEEDEPQTTQEHATGEPEASADSGGRADVAFPTFLDPDSSSDGPTTG